MRAEELKNIDMADLGINDDEARNRTNIVCKCIMDFINNFSMHVLSNIKHNLKL